MTQTRRMSGSVNKSSTTFPPVSTLSGKSSATTSLRLPAAAAHDVCPIHPLSLYDPQQHGKQSYSDDSQQCCDTQKKILVRGVPTFGVVLLRLGDSGM